MTTIEPRQIQPRGLQHVTFFGIFFIFVFGIFGYPFWYLMRVILPPSVTLAAVRTWFSPVVLGGTSVHYIGFLVPLSISITYSVLFIRSVPLWWKFSKSTWVLLAIIPVSILMSRYTLLGVFVSVGLTDPILLVAFSIFMYHQALFRGSAQAALLSYPLGFILGFISDLESTEYFGGVFGGYGLGDGDFIFPLAFFIGTLLFSLTWRAILNGIRSLESKLQEVIHRRGQD